MLVFEDLHWADDGLLDFVDQLVDWATRRAAARRRYRPARAARAPAGLGRRQAQRDDVSLAPLSDGGDGARSYALLDRPLLRRTRRRGCSRRAGGNPLYAEEYVRCSCERGGELALPETVQGIIAARLDALSAERRSCSRTRPSSARSSGSGRRGGGASAPQAEELLLALERKEFVRRERGSSVAGETEYAFRHVLIRDVAYSQIPRAQRARASTGGRPTGSSRSAGPRTRRRCSPTTTYRRSSSPRRPGSTGRSSRVRRTALRDAGDRAASLYRSMPPGVSSTPRFELWPRTIPERADLLFRRAAPIGRHVGGGDIERLVRGTGRPSRRGRQDASRRDGDPGCSGPTGPRAERELLRRARRAVRLLGDGPAEPVLARTGPRPSDARASAGGRARAQETQGRVVASSLAGPRARAMR